MPPYWKCRPVVWIRVAGLGCRDGSEIMARLTTKTSRIPGRWHAVTSCMGAGLEQTHVETLISPLPHQPDILVQKLIWFVFSFKMKVKIRASLFSQHIFETKSHERKFCAESDLTKGMRQILAWALLKLLQVIQTSSCFETYEPKY